MGGLDEIQGRLFVFARVHRGRGPSPLLAGFSKIGKIFLETLVLHCLVDPQFLNNDRSGYINLLIRL
ncbi:MAG: hypothetical protein RJA81_193 [Planctomycetota bacterium]